MLIRQDFQFLLASARPGEAICYYTGDLMLDRLKLGKGSQLEMTAQAAWDAHLLGQCHLTQRKLGPNQYEYIAIKTAVSKPVVYNGCYNREFLLGSMPSKPKPDPKPRKSRAGYQVTDWLPSAPAFAI